MAAVTSSARTTPLASIAFAWNAASIASRCISRSRSARRSQQPADLGTEPGQRPDELVDDGALPRRRNRRVRENTSDELSCERTSAANSDELAANAIGLAALLGDIEESERVLARDGAGGHG